MALGDQSVSSSMTTAAIATRHPLRMAATRAVTTPCDEFEL